MATINLADMALESEGEGPPVVMLHGLGGTSNTFQPLVPALAGFRLVRPDLPGAGRSAIPPQPITVALLVEAVTEMPVRRPSSAARLRPRRIGLCN